MEPMPTGFIFSTGPLPLSAGRNGAPASQIYLPSLPDSTRQEGDSTECSLPSAQTTPLNCRKESSPGDTAGSWKTPSGSSRTCGSGAIKGGRANGKKNIENPGSVNLYLTGLAALTYLYGNPYNKLTMARPWVNSQYQCIIFFTVCYTCCPCFPCVFYTSFPTDCTCCCTMDSD